MTRFIWQTVLKLLSVTDAKNGAITPSLIPLQCRYRQDLDGGTKHRTNVYAACIGGVVCLSLDICKVWRIIPCVYKIYTLGQFQFHSLLRRSLVARVAGNHAHMHAHAEHSRQSILGGGCPCRLAVVLGDLVDVACPARNMRDSHHS
jgi:hypothetical protein